MEYQLRTERPADHQQLEQVIKAWLRDSPTTSGVGQSSGFSASGSSGFASAGSGVGSLGSGRRITSPAHNVFSSHQMQTAEGMELAPGIHLQQLSEMGGKYDHVFVLGERNLLLVRQAGLHAEWVRLMNNWHQPLSLVMPTGADGLASQAVSGQGGSGRGYFQTISWGGGPGDPDVRSMSEWQKLLWAAFEGAKQFGPEAMAMIEELLTLSTALMLLGMGLVLLIPGVGEVVIGFMVGSAILDLLLNVTRLFKLYYETAVGARSQTELKRAGKYFAQAMLAGLLDVLAICGSPAIVARFRSLRTLGPLKLRSWTRFLTEQGQTLKRRLQGGGRIKLKTIDISPKPAALPAGKPQLPAPTTTKPPTTSKPPTTTKPPTTSPTKLPAPTTTLPPLRTPPAKVGMPPILPQFPPVDEPQGPASMGSGSPSGKPKESTQEWVDENGNIIWPPNDGFAGAPEPTVLQPGTMIDRYGYDGGTFVSPEGEPYGDRSLAPGTENKPYSVFEVVKPIECMGGEAAPWFGEPGGATQYKLNKSIEQLIEEGYIVRKTK